MGTRQGGPDLTPARWLVIEITLPPGSEAGVWADVLVSLGSRGAEERDGTLIAYLPAPPDAALLVERVTAELSKEVGQHDLTFSWRWQAQEDWDHLWKRGLASRRITDRIVVHPSWLVPDTQPGDIVIELDPGMAFGTAEHGTTRGCVRLLDGLVRPGQTILDVGSGSGILSICAARLGALSVLAVDADPLATVAAGENADANGVADLVSVETSRVTPDWLERGQLWGGVVANLETPILLPLLPGLSGVVEPDGWLILSGILVDETDLVRRALAENDPRLREVASDTDGEWWSGAFRRG